MDAKQLSKEIIKLGNDAKNDFLRTKVHQYFPPKPKVINLLANDICNSKCTMCNIWKNKLDYEFKPEELRKALSDDLFKEVKHVGVTGGEPTLRKDLPEIYEAICASLPNLEDASCITNAIQTKQVIDRIERSYNVCKSYGKKFTIMISVDGIGEVHDKVRGRKGNFESCMEVYEYFRKFEDITLLTGYTVTKDNVWHVEQQLEYLINNNIKGRFRIAEFIDRLYNKDESEKIRNFDLEERAHLAYFFRKLELSYEQDEGIKRTYSSIQGMLMGQSRQIACPYHTNGVVLDCRGNLHYCAPKSKVIGNSREESAWSIFKNNLNERRRIMEEQCSDCIHDYHAPMTFHERRLEVVRKFYEKFISLKYVDSKRILSMLKAMSTKIATAQKSIVITGWYGTETTGDKAILGAIYNTYKERYPDAQFTVTSIYPHLTKRTLQELNISAKIVPVYSNQFVSVAASCDVMVMGGGPLMEIEYLAIPLWAFKIASSKGAKCIVHGCGIGPLFTDRFSGFVKQLLQLSDEIILRDSKSVELAEKWLPGRGDIKMLGDPAAKYVESRGKLLSTPKEPLKVTLFLRELTHEYFKHMSLSDFERLKDAFEAHLAAYLIRLVNEYNADLHFHTMHNFVVGNDDRSFNRRFTSKYLDGIDYKNFERLTTVDNVITAMKSSELNICMRFHSVLMAETLGENYLAIDYTNGGKIEAFLTDSGKKSQMESIDDFIEKSEHELYAEYKLPFNK